MNVGLAVFLALLSSVAANAQAVPSVVRPRSPNSETPLPKVVFFGDGYTAGWPLPAGSNWINKGVAGIFTAGLTSSEAVAAFESDVVRQHPAIVHIMVGENDAAEANDATYAGTSSQYIDHITTMVNEARAANIQVILGNIAPGTGAVDDAVFTINAALDAYGAANDIQVINYYDALCGCVGSTGGYGIGVAYMTAPQGLVETPLLAPSTATSIQRSDGGYVPTAAGYRLMTQMAQSAINNLSFKLQSGWLQNVTLLSPDYYQPFPNVNTVSLGQFVQFTPIGLYSNGSQLPFVNNSFPGASGTWTSSNPLVMYVTQTGKVSALTVGTAIIRYRSPNGVPFSEWIMYVTPAATD
jgi:lysophospholipase L1-like esterase